MDVNQHDMASSVMARDQWLTEKTQLTTQLAEVCMTAAIMPHTHCHSVACGVATCFVSQMLLLLYLSFLHTQFRRYVIKFIVALLVSLKVWELAWSEKADAISPFIFIVHADGS